ncbi:MAG: hypothetical protein ACREC6_04065, partial [Hyphomicrobiaceae bacterium]
MRFSDRIRRDREGRLDLYFPQPVVADEAETIDLCALTVGFDPIAGLYAGAPLQRGVLVRVEGDMAGAIGGSLQLTSTTDTVGSKFDEEFGVWLFPFADTELQVQAPTRQRLSLSVPLLRERLAREGAMSSPEQGYLGKLAVQVVVGGIARETPCVSVPEIASYCFRYNLSACFFFEIPAAGRAFMLFGERAEPEPPPRVPLRLPPAQEPDSIGPDQTARVSFYGLLRIEGGTAATELSVRYKVAAHLNGFDAQQWVEARVVVLPAPQGSVSAPHAEQVLF